MTDEPAPTSPERSNPPADRAGIGRRERVDALLDAPPEQRDALIARLFGDESRFPDGIADRYRLERELGRGGMATVWLAHDRKHHRDVAVKVVRPSISAALGAERFLREIEIVAKLHHPHIVPLFDSGEADGALYYVMPFESGQSLRQRMEHAHGPLPPEDVVAILRDVCDALAYAHAQGIVHRDIKPDNVLLSGRHAMVADFGIAKALEESSTDARTGERRITQSGTHPADADAFSTAVGVALGTPAYMAPEQITAEPVIDQRADIYAVGVLAYELLAGHLPYRTSAPRELLAAHLDNEAPPRLAGVGTRVPPALAELVMRCLAKRPEDRWQSADEMLSRLGELGPGARAGRRSAVIGAVAIGAAVIVLVAAGVVAWRGSRTSAEQAWRNRWSRARIEKVTDFPGSEVDAAISPDGRTVAFLADRDSSFDAFVTPVGSGRYVNLTGGRLAQLYNEDVRNIGFTQDASRLWLRVASLTAPASVSLLPSTGEGAPQPFLPTAVMAAWSPDGSRLAYHETTPGDPIYLAGADGSNPRRIYIAPPGTHSHHLSWSPDGRSLYFAHGFPPDEMDVWRMSVSADGVAGAPERMTQHNSRVSYPVMVDDNTLFYTATGDDGGGPWLYAMDVARRVPTRLSAGVEHFVSIAASAGQPGAVRRFVATVSNPAAELWTVPVSGGVAAEEGASRVSLPTARAVAPRYLPDGSLLYLASRGGADALWRLPRGGVAAELWRPGDADGAIVSAPAVSPDGRTACFALRRAARSTLRCVNADGGIARTVAEQLDVRGASSWSPDGRWLAVGARVGASIRVFKVPVAGGAPVRLVDSVSSNPVWSPDGSVIIYSGTPRGRSVSLGAVTPDGKPVTLGVSGLQVDRLGDSYRFAGNGAQLVAKLGGFRRQDFWLVDVRTGARRQLTRLGAGESLNRFDVSPDGRQIVFERVRENADIALIEVPR
ncbi:MAG TPA: protein kinase [Gemmatimonadaceae bacterium]|nr:protein kinase [Gemmatimonadaceae bacterium]